MGRVGPSSGEGQMYECLVSSEKAVTPRVMFAQSIQGREVSTGGDGRSWLGTN